MDLMVRNVTVATDTISYIAYYRGKINTWILHRQLWNFKYNTALSNSYILLSDGLF